MSSLIEQGIETRTRAKRGFAAMDQNKQREIASKGGKAAHEKGTAHEWTGEEAKEAGRKGGAASHRHGRRIGSDEPAPAEQESSL